jgi:hypothetical protein
MTDRDHDVLYLLQRWYVAQCDDDWEHSEGVTIETLDNPGWRVRINLRGTELESVVPDWVKVQRSEHDWLQWRATEAVFEAACGPTNLGEALAAFLNLSDDKPYRSITGF